MSQDKMLLLQEIRSLLNFSLSIALMLRHLISLVLRGGFIKLNSKETRKWSEMHGSETLISNTGLQSFVINQSMICPAMCVGVGVS